MTFEVLEARYLSLRSWLWGCVLPGALCVFGLLMVLGYGTNDITQLNHNAVIIGFFGLYIVLVRGGHLLMIRSLHFDLKRKYQAEYYERLAALPPSLRSYNIGFTLARIKRDLLS